MTDLLDVMSFSSLSRAQDPTGRGVSMAEAAAASMDMRKQQQQEMVRQALPALMAQVDPRDPQGSMAKLVQAGLDVDNAAKVVKVVLDSEQENRLQQGQKIYLDTFGQSTGGTPAPAEGDAAATPTAPPAGNSAEAMMSQADRLERAGMALGASDPERARLILQRADAMRQQANKLIDRDTAEKQRKEDRQSKLDDEANKPLTQEAATKVALANQGNRSIGALRKLVYDKDGSLDRTVLAELTDIPLIGQIKLSQKARQVYTLAYGMTDARLRLTTGAQAPEHEIKATMKSYLPSLLDDSETVELKFKELGDFFNEFTALQGKGGASKVNQGAAASDQPAPPMPDAKQAKDGKWYVPDPQRPGKYLEVQP